MPQQVGDLSGEPWHTARAFQRNFWKSTFHLCKSVADSSPMKPPEPDAAFEISPRPPAFSEFTGQVKVRERLELMVEAAKKRGDVLEHILLSGPSGLGKTTLAFIIANAMSVNIKNNSGPEIERSGELDGLLTRLVKDYDII